MSHMLKTVFLFGSLFMFSVETRCCCRKWHAEASLHLLMWCSSWLDCLFFKWDTTKSGRNTKFKKQNTQIHKIHIKIIRTIEKQQLKQLHTEFGFFLLILRVPKFCSLKSVCWLFQAKEAENLKAFFPNLEKEIQIERFWDLKMEYKNQEYVFIVYKWTQTLNGLSQVS